MGKKGLAALIIICMASITLFACSGGGNGGDEPEPKEEVNAEVEAFNAYKDILSQNRSGIEAYTWQLEIESFEDWGAFVNKQVAFLDVTGDDIPELFFMKVDDDNQYMATLHIFTYVDGAAKEVTNSDLEKFDDHNVAAGVKYVLYATGQPGKLFLYYLGGDESAIYRVNEFTLAGDGTLTTDNTLENIVGPKYDNTGNYTGTGDEYYENGKAVSNKDGQAKFTAAFKQIKTPILLSGPMGDDVSLWKNFNKADGKGMSYDEAMAYIEGKIS